MRVLVVATNQEHEPDPVLPLGAALAAGVARAAGHEVQLFDACFAGVDAVRQLQARLDAWGPEVVCLSLRNVDDVAWPRARSLVEGQRALARAARAAAPRAALVLGGSAFSLFPAELVRELGADLGVVGEAETALPAVLAELARGRRPPGAPRVFAPSPGGGFAAPDVEPALDLVDVGAYLERGGCVGIQTKRGCALPCGYCTYPQLEGRAYRPRDPARVVDAMERLHRAHGVDHFFIVDNVFNAPPAHARALCAALAERRLPVRWTAFVSPAHLDAALLESMRGAGCTSVELGTDAAHPDTLARLGKPFGVEEVRAASRACRAVGLPHCHCLILGGPGETAATLAETVRVIDETEPTAVIAMLGVRLYPGTSLAAEALRLGHLAPGALGLEPVFWLSEALHGELEDRARAIAASRRRWQFPGLVSEGRRRALRRLRGRGVRGPLWELLGTPHA